MIAFVYQQNPKITSLPLKNKNKFHVRLVTCTSDITTTPIA